MPRPWAPAGDTALLPLGGATGKCCWRPVSPGHDVSSCVMVTLVACVPSALNFITVAAYAPTAPLFDVVAAEPCPVVLEVLPHLADPAGGDLELAAQVLGPLVPGHRLDDPPAHGPSRSPTRPGSRYGRRPGLARALRCCRVAVPRRRRGDVGHRRLRRVAHWQAHGGRQRLDLEAVPLLGDDAHHILGRFMATLPPTAFRSTSSISGQGRGELGSVLAQLREPDEPLPGPEQPSRQWHPPSCNCRRARSNGLIEGELSPSPRQACLQKRKWSHAGAKKSSSPPRTRCPARK